MHDLDAPMMTGTGQTEPTGLRDQAGASEPRRSTGARLVEACVVVAAIAFGTYERWWVAAHNLGTLTSDGAVIGLMALHVLHHGQVPAYMWGQSYGGGAEALLTAAAFALVSTSTATLLATTAATSALATLAMWWAGRAIVGRRAALLASLAWWVWPSLFLWRSLKPGGTYVVGLAIAWVAVGALARARGGDRRVGWLVLAGVCAGLSVWSSPMTLQLLVPAAWWCWAMLRTLGLRRWGVLAGATVLGALPALWFGVTHSFSNLLVPGGSGGLIVGAPERLVQFFWLELPIAVAGRVEGSFDWVGGPLGFLASIGALWAFVAVARRVRAGTAERCRLAVYAGLCLPVLFAFNQDASVAGQGRYVMLGASMVALLVGVALDNLDGVLTRWWRSRGAPPRPSRSLPRVGVAWVVGLALLATFGAVAIRDEPARLMAEFPVGGVRMPPDDGALRSLVAAHHVTDAYASYWMAYRLTFETSEATIAVPFFTPRYPPLSARVAASPHPAYLFVAASPTFGWFVAWCASHHIEVRIFRRGAFAVVQPAVRVLPGQLPHSVLS